MSVTLYELAEHWLRIQDAIIEADGEITPVIQEELDSWEGDLASKVDSIGYLVRNAESRASVERAHAEQFQAELERYKKRAQVQENTAKRLKAYLLNAMLQLGIPKVQAERFTARIQRNSTPSTNAAELDPVKLPERFQRVTVEVNAAELVRAWKDKEELPEDVRIEVGQHLRIS